jgi:hypothetical protein
LMDQPFFKDVYYPMIKVNKHYKYIKHSFHMNTFSVGNRKSFNYLESLELSYLSLSQTLTQKVVSFDVLFHADEL